MSFYDERPDWLSATIASLTKWGVDHLIALDGAYFLYPEGRHRSSTFQHLAILEAAAAIDIGLTLAWPDTVWTRNETEKRTQLFRHADTISTPGEDWYLIWDADQFALNTTNLKHELAKTTLDAAETTCEQPEHTGDITHMRIRNLFRAHHGITVQGNHYTYLHPDGTTKLWGQARAGHPHGGLAPAHDATMAARFEHRTTQRPPRRIEAARNYYQLRDSLAIELGQCTKCKTAPARHANISEVTGRWLPHANGFEAQYVNVCEPCKARIESSNRAIVKARGLNPDTMAREHLPA